MTEVLAGLSSRAIASGLGVLLLVACSTGGSTQQSASSTYVTQWVAWGGQELTAYRDVLKPFESKTGIKVHVTTNRESTTAIANATAANTPNTSEFKRSGVSTSARMSSRVAARSTG